MKYKSEILKVMHQDAIEAYKIGVISEARMREYDEMCLKNPRAEASHKKPSDIINELVREKIAVSI